MMLTSFRAAFTTFITIRCCRPHTLQRNAMNPSQAGRYDALFGQVRVGLICCACLIGGDKIASTAIAKTPPDGESGAQGIYTHTASQGTRLRYPSSRTRPTTTI